MMTIPPDIDALMWKIADQADLTALADFGKRFPEHLPELSKRMQAVEGLRHAKNLYLPTQVIPIFRPSSTPTHPFPWKWASIAGVVVAAVMAVAYVVRPSQVQGDIDTRPLSGGRHRIGIASDQEEPRRVRVKPDKGVPSPIGDSTPVEQVPAPNRENPVPQQARPPEAPRPHVSLKAVPLQVAIHSVANQCHFEAQMAPDLTNPDVTIDYDGLTGREILRDLGKKYGFSVVDDGENAVIIIPLKPQA